MQNQFWPVFCTKNCGSGSGLKNAYWGDPCQNAQTWKSPSPILMKIGGVVNIYEKLKTPNFFLPATSRGRASGLGSFGLEAMWPIFQVP